MVGAKVGYKGQQNMRMLQRICLTISIARSEMSKRIDLAIQNLKLQTSCEHVCQALSERVRVLKKVKGRETSEETQDQGKKPSSMHFGSLLCGNGLSKTW